MGLISWRGAVATPDTIGDSLLQDSPTVILNAETGERVPHWVDRDEWVVQAKLRIDAGEDKPNFPTLTRSVEELREEQAMMLRPAVRLDDETRYIVAFRDVVDDEGALVPPSSGFEALRDEEPSDDDVIESRHAHFEEIFTILGAHIMARTIGGVVNLAPLIRPVWGIEEKSGSHTGSAMLEVDFGNDRPPITNIPHWGDRFPDPHGRAAELEGPGPALLQFYGTGQIENPCTDASGLNPGPCDQDDLIQP